MKIVKETSRAYSSVAERLTADQQVSSSTLDAPSLFNFFFRLEKKSTILFDSDKLSGIDHDKF